MSNGLRAKVQSWLEGKSNAVARLSVHADVSPTSIRVFLNGRTPTFETAYRLALACGCSEEDAITIAGECASERARESA